MLALCHKSLTDGEFCALSVLPSLRKVELCDARLSSPLQTCLSNLSALETLILNWSEEVDVELLRLLRPLGIRKLSLSGALLNREILLELKHWNSLESLYLDPEYHRRCRDCTLDLIEKAQIIRIGPD